MTSLSDSPRSGGYGLPKLLERYVQRAEGLTKGSSYRSVVDRARSEWNAAYPRYLTGHPSDTPDAAPQKLVDDEEYLTTLLKRADTLRESLDEFEAAIESALSKFHIRTATEGWSDLVSIITDRFWPDQHFPHRYFPGGHPASRFVGVCLHRDPRILQGECDQYFDLPVLSLQAHYVGPEPVPDFDTYMNNLVPYIPLYPGVSVGDIESKASEFAEQADILFGDKTPLARMVALREAGLIHREIGERLGLEEKAVQKALQKLSKQTENSPKFSGEKPT